MPSSPRTGDSERRGRHPDFGRLIRDEYADTVICHVCGRDFRSLGAHVRVHDMTAAEYRQEFGLLRSRPLSARSFVREQSLARRDRYRNSGELRAGLEAGRAMARSAAAREPALGPVQEGLTTVEHRWLVDETPWPEQATPAYGEMVELTPPHPPIPELGRLGPESVGSRGVIVACVVG